MTRFRLILLGLLTFLIIGFFRGVTAYTDWLWFRSLGYSKIFITNWAYGLIVGLITAVLTLLILGLNVWLAGRMSLKTYAVLENREADRLWRQTRGYIEKYFKWAAYLGTVTAAWLAGLSMGSTWETWLQYAAAVPAGVKDPLFGLDIGFYFFTLPAIEIVYYYLIGVLVIAFGLAVLIHLPRGNFNLGGLRAVHSAGRNHIAVLGGLILTVYSANWWIAGHQLVYSQRGAVFGAGYTDAKVLLPVYNLLVYLTLAVAIIFVVGMVAGRWLPVVGALAGLAAFWLVGTAILPNVVQQYRVSPNEIASERPYIARNIKYTRKAFGLDKVVRRPFPVADELTTNAIAENRGSIEGLRLWDWRPLKKTFGQIQEIRLYYRFNDVDLDRYEIDGRYQQVALSAREIDVGRLPEAARTWVNSHLVYTHGYGLVVSPINEVVGEGLPELIVKNIPPESTRDLKITRPEIYFGELTNDYVVVGTKTREFDFPAGEKNKYTSYAGKDGVSLKNYLTKVAFAYRFGTAKLMFSGALTAKSRILFHRNVKDRLETLMPFLKYDEDPYLVLVGGRLYWMVDGYTTSSRYPYSKPAANGLNYFRNSVKVVVDAYDGTVDFYISDPQDPIIKTYARAYPGVFKPEAAMNKELQRHIRYPEALFKVQAEVFSSFHMEDPQVYYNKEDLWDVPNELYDAGQITMEPYYVIMRLPGEESLEYVMIMPFTPTNKSNMVSWLAARSDPPNYGQLILYDFPKEKLVYGPMQIEARLDQEPEISRQLSLWNQRGSKVIRGNLLVVPIGDNVLYVEPIYLQAEVSELPELKRVAVGFGNKVVMEPTLEEGIASLLGQVGAAPRAGEGAAEPRPPEPGKGQSGAGKLDPQAVKKAASAFEKAESAQRKGDWAEYGRQMDALKEALEELR